MTDEPNDALDCQRAVEDAAGRLQHQLLGFITAQLESGPPERRLIATLAVADLFGRLLVSEIADHPGAQRSALLMLAGLVDAVNAAVSAPGEKTH